MKIDRPMRGGMMVLAVLACACGRGDAGSAGAAGDSTAASASVPPASTAPAAPPSTAPADPGDFSRWALRADGVGPVKVGMTVAQADSALNGGLDSTTGLEACDYVRPRQGPEGLSLMVVDGRIARVDVVDSARVPTTAGVMPGESEARVREAYPGARVQPHKYDDRGHYFVVIPGAPSDTLHRIVFETDGTKVTRMRGGLFPAVEFVEGCS